MSGIEQSSHSASPREFHNELTEPRFGKPELSDVGVLSGWQNAAAEQWQQSQKKNSPVQQVSGDEFIGTARQLLVKLDRNHAGEITRSRLAKAVEDPSLRGKEAQTLAAMYKSFDSLHNLSGHEGWFASHTLTSGDLENYAAILKTHNDTRALQSWAQANLNYFDRNNNGSLSRDEIARALKDTHTSDQDRKVLRVIESNYSKLGHFYESGVKIRAINDYANGICQDTASGILVTDIYSSCYNVNKSQQPEISHALYSDSKDPLKSITPDAIRQGSIGDCYFESSLASVALAHPELIQNAIKDNHDGTYTVTFAGHKNNPIRIKAPTEAEQGLYNHGSQNGLWASVMEKAYGAYRQQYIWRRSLANPGGGYTPAEGADGGGKTADVLPLLTGKAAFTKSTCIEPAEMAADLEKAFSGNLRKCVTAAVHADCSGNSVTQDRFYTNHAYSIVGFSPDGKGGGMVTIRNPWGGQDGTTSGKISIPLRKFMQNFSDVTFER